MPEHDSTKCGHFSTTKIGERCDYCGMTKRAETPDDGATIRVEYDDQAHDVVGKVSKALAAHGLTIEMVEGGDGWMGYRVVPGPVGKNPFADREASR